MKWRSEYIARREGIQEWIPKILDLSSRKDIWQKGYFIFGRYFTLKEKVFYFKRKCAHLTTSIITLACAEKRNLHY